MNIAALQNTARSSPGIQVAPPLIIPVIDYSNGRQPGLGRDQLSNPNKSVALIAHLPGTYYPGFYVELFWNNASVTAFPLEDSHFINQQISFNVLPRFILQPDQGVYEGEVYYTIFDPRSGTTDRCDTRRVMVKTTVPGDPDPNNDTPYINGGCS